MLSTHVIALEAEKTITKARGSLLSANLSRILPIKMCKNIERGNSNVFICRESQQVYHSIG